VPVGGEVDLGPGQWLAQGVFSQDNRLPRGLSLEEPKE